MKRIFHRTGNRVSYEYNLISKQIQLLRTIIKEAVNIENAKIFNDKLEKIKPGPTAFKEIYNILGKRKSPFCQQIMVNNTKLCNNIEISEHFREYYSSVFSENVPENPVEYLVNRISSYVDAIPRHIYTFDANFGSFVNQDSYHFTDLNTIK